MAIQQLTQPILNPIVAFDATQQHIISFIVIGGTQVVANRLTVQDNQTGNVIYSQIQSSLKLEHILPANTLQNGGYYNAVIETIDNANNISSPSTPVPFYCYSSPTLTITNIPATETIGNGTYKFEGNYSQTEGELLNSYQFTLYNSNKEVLTQTPLIYYSVNNSLSYTFVGMNNDTSYYIELSGQTVNNTKVTTGLLYFTVRYIQPASFAICDLVNNCDDGYIQVSSNIVAIDGHSNPDPPIYIDDKEVDLTDPDAWVNWNSGFRIQDDFTMGAWGRDFNDYQNIITLTNDINTEKTPNRIELKWMIGDVVKEQLYYENINGKFINIENSKVGDIKNLEIYGNSTQFTTSAEYNTASGNPVQFEDGKEGTSLRIQELDGKSTQATRSGKNIFNIFDENWKVYNGTKQTDGSIKANVQGQYFISIQNTTDYWKNYIMQNKGRTLTFSQKKIIDGYTLGIVIYGTRTSTTSGYQAIDGSAGTREISVTIADDFTSVSMVELRILRKIPPATFTDTTTVITELQLEEGNVATDYEPYGASPSPEFPSEIQSVGDDVNLFDESILSEYTDRGITWKYDNITKKINISGTATSSYSQTNYFRLSLRPGTYYFSIFGDTSLKYGIWFYNSDNKLIGTIKASGSAIITEDVAKIGLYVEGLTSGNNYLKNVNFKLQKGDKPTPYSKYGEGTLNIEQSSSNLFNASKITNTTISVLDSGKTIKMPIATSGNGYTNVGTNLKGVCPKLEVGDTVYLLGDTTSQINKHIYLGGNSKFVWEFGKSRTLTENDLNSSFVLYGNNFEKGETEQVIISNLRIVKNESDEWEQYFNNTYTLPLSAPLRSLPNGTKDTIEEDGIHRRVGSVVLDGSDDETYGVAGEGNTTDGFSMYTTFVISNIKNSAYKSLLCNYFKFVERNNVISSTKNFITGGGNTSIVLNIDRSLLETEDVAGFKKWLQQNPITVNYELAEEVVEPFTDEQLEVINSIVTEKGTNIINSQTYMILNYNYISANIPSPNNKLPVFSVGDIKNLINISNLNISYNQQYYLDVNTQFLLKPNYTYTLSFDFNINEASTDLYYSLGYGTDRYSTDMTKTTIYSNQTKGRNEITFTVSADIPDNSYLWVRFARTIILADINVDISNIQLEKGKSATSYQSPNEYNIYPIITENNFYDYNNPLYVKGQNVIYTEIDNGYNIKPKIVNTDTYLAIGIKNILTNGNLYGISYSILGELDNVRLYRTNKNSQNIIDEIKIDKGIFIAPNSSYDLQLVFNINSSSLLNYVQIWNIQLEANDVISSYQLYNKNYSQIILEEPLRGIEKYQDWIGITSPNLLNPETGSAKVEEETDYFYNKLVTYTTNVTVQYKNISGNIISSEILAQDSLISTPKNCVEIHIEGLDKETIKSNHLQIRKGTSNEPYLPYITEPSVIKYIKKVVLDGSTQIDDIGTNDYGYTWMVLSKKIASDALKGRIRAPMCNIAKGTNNSGYRNYKENLICQWNDTSASFCMALSTDIVGDSALKVQEFFQKQYDNGTSVEIYYMLAEPEVFPLSSTNIEELKSLVTYEPISNIFTNNDVLATLSLDYANSMILQDTQNAYVLLKCWNGNKMPYVIHSNYIDIPETTDNVFIWMRRKKNIFDLKIENLTKGS